MNILKGFILALGLLIVITSNVLAVNIQDDYYGFDENKDVVGNPDNFAVSSMDVELVGNTLYVDIHTNFGGKGDKGLFADNTIDPRGIGYGDLFLSSEWTPDTSGSNYINDSHETGTKWEYGVAMDDSWGVTGGDVTLYELSGITNDENAILSDDMFTSSTDESDYRNGQEVLVDELSSTVTALDNSGNWVSLENSGLVSFQIDLTGTSLLNGSEIALHWGMTCANDTIEGALPTPEPGTVALLSIGLIGLAGGAARKRIKKTQK